MEKKLPFASKPKNLSKQDKIERPVVIGYSNEKEKETARLLNQLGSLKNEKNRKRKIKQADSNKKRMKRVEKEKTLLEEKAKLARKRVFRLQGIEESKSKKRKLNSGEIL